MIRSHYSLNISFYRNGPLEDIYLKEFCRLINNQQYVNINGELTTLFLKVLISEDTPCAFNSSCLNPLESH